MAGPTLQKVDIDPDEIDTLREHFDAMNDQSELVQGGFAVEDKLFEAVWIDEDDATLYCYERHGDDFPPDEAAVEAAFAETEGLEELAETQHEVFETVTVDDAEWVELDADWFQAGPDGNGA